MKRFAILTVQFYKLLAWYNVAFTLIGVALFMFAHLPINLVSFLFAKLMGLSIALLLYGFTVKQTFYYFRNAGFRVRSLMLSVFIPDIMIYGFIAAILSIFHG